MRATSSHRPDANSATPFTSFNNLTAQQQTDLGSVDVMDYIRGKQLGLEVSQPLLGQTLGFRDRTTLLGSIVSSSPRYSKAPNFGYQLNPAAGGGSTYAQFVANNQNNRRAAVYVGANAGMFHAFDANPNANQGGGAELFAYVPRSVYPYLSELTDVNYTHRYFVDGPVVEGDVYLNGTWKTVVMGSTGAGPAGLFALDVTTPDQFDATKVLWDITPAEEPDLGRVMGYGYIGSVKDGQNAGKYVAIVPNGYQSTNNHAVLLVIDMQTGQTLRKIDTCKKNNGVPFAANEQGGRCDPANEINGLANVSVIFDANRNVVGAYSGDYQGNLWKFDLSNADPTPMAHRDRGSERRVGQYADTTVLGRQRRKSAAADHSPRRAPPPTRSAVRTWCSARASSSSTRTRPAPRCSRSTGCGSSPATRRRSPRRNCRAWDSRRPRRTT